MIYLSNIYIILIIIRFKTISLHKYLSHTNNKLGRGRTGMFNTNLFFFFLYNIQDIIIYNVEIDPYDGV